jgi:biotin carboxylase
MSTLVITALNPTDSVTEGFLPAAARLGLDVTVLTDEPEAHRRAYRGTPVECTRVLPCQVRDRRALISRVAQLGLPDGLFSNSDHLQEVTALAAGYFGLPGKDWAVAMRAKDKFLARHHLAALGIDEVRTAAIYPDTPTSAITVPFPAVLKPRYGVASEHVVLVRHSGDLAQRIEHLRARDPRMTLVAEEYLPGPLHTLETLGDGERLRVLGGFRTRLSPPPYFVEERLDWHPALPRLVRQSVLDQLAALGIGFGACHTEFVVQGDEARLIEVNYRLIGDLCDFSLAELLGEPLFEQILRIHLGERLPAALPAPPGGHARIEYVCATRSGTLRSAPPRTVHEGPVRLTYQPLRRVGDAVTLSHTNRDYLGVVRGVADDAAAVDRAVEDFLATRRWEVVP